MDLYTSRSRIVALMIWMVASIFYAYQYILRVMPSIMLEDIMQQFNINAAAFGQFSGIYYIGYSLMHLPIGVMLDRYGPRKIMTLSILLSVIGLLPIIFAKHWIYPIIGRALIGIGSSAAILGIFKIVRMTFSQTLFTRMLSLSVTIGLIGAIYGGGPLSYMTETLGYQSVIKIFIVSGVLLALVTYWIVPDAESSQDSTMISNIKEVLNNKNIVWTCLFAGLMVGPLEGFADVWGAAFLKQVYGFENPLAVKLPSLIFIGMCFGAPILSLVAEKTNHYLLTIIGSGIIMVINFFTLLMGHPSPPLICVSFILVGICCSYQILAIYKASTYAPEHVVGLTTAIANMIIMIFGYVFHTLMGLVVNIMGGPNSSAALVYGVIIIPIALCIGVGGFTALFLQEKELKECLKSPIG
jgi:predicted MFS family arabinose efflux permease